MRSVEERLRAALAAKAASVTHDDLGSPRPPSRRPAVALRRGLRVAAVVALAAVLVAVLLLLPQLLARSHDPVPAGPPSPPASPSRTAVPAPPPDSPGPRAP
jgi:hypothetical protein